VTDTDDSFLSRWSRRKRVVEPAPAEPEQAAPEPEVPEPPALTEEDIAALPRIEDLVEGSDIKAFLRPGVPAALKNAALRRIWLLTPAIRDYRDPAVDYAWDWNTPGGVPGDGCGPSPERAAQMLRDLFDPPKPNPEPELAPGADTAPEPLAPESPVLSGDDPASTQTLPEQTFANAPQDTTPEPPPAGPRRHGGALPS
jgi:hypothetical protein